MIDNLDYIDPTVDFKEYIVPKTYNQKKIKETLIWHVPIKKPKNFMALIEEKASDYPSPFHYDTLKP